MKISKEEKGITLIALVVTIIVLIILAGISIRALTGDTNIISNAKLAKCMNTYYGEDDKIRRAYDGVAIDIKVKSSQDSHYDARTKENVIKFAKNIAKDLEKEKYTIAYKYVEGEATDVDKAYIWVKVADSVLKEGAIQKKDEDGATYNRPLNDGYAVARITIDRKTSSYVYDVDIENDVPETGDTVTDKTLMAGGTFESFTEVATLKGESSGGSGGGTGGEPEEPPVELPEPGTAVPAGGWSVAVAKGLVKRDGLAAHIGEEVDYNPPAGGTWRIFYYDNEDQGNGKGYFGDPVGTVYLVREPYSTTIDFATEERNDDLFYRMNPLYSKASFRDIDTPAEVTCSGMCGSTILHNFEVPSISVSTIACPSLEMTVRACSWDSRTTVTGCQAVDYYGGVRALYRMASGGITFTANSLDAKMYHPCIGDTNFQLSTPTTTTTAQMIARVYKNHMYNYATLTSSISPVTGLR